MRSCVWVSLWPSQRPSPDRPSTDCDIDTSVARCKPGADQRDSKGMPNSPPAGLTQYALNNHLMKIPYMPRRTPRHSRRSLGTLSTARGGEYHRPAIGQRLCRSCTGILNRTLAPILGTPNGTLALLSTYDYLFGWQSEPALPKIAAFAVKCALTQHNGNFSATISPCSRRYSPRTISTASYKEGDRHCSTLIVLANGTRV